MRIGVTVPNAGPLATTDALVGLAEYAEQAGFDSVWVADHLIIPTQSSQPYPYARPDLHGGQGHAGLPPDWPFLDPLIALAAIAARTSRILLGTGVYLLPLRHPIATAKMAASLDILSSGRLLLGVGLGWIREEYETLGISWSDRGRLMDEQIDMIRSLWRNARPEFHGTFWQVEGLGFAPKPAGGALPILIGGNNDPARGRAAARGDGWHLIDLDPEAIRQHAAQLADDCASFGRSAADVPLSMYASISIEPETVSDTSRQFPLMGTVDQIAARLSDYRDAGLAHIVLAARGLTTREAYEDLFSVIQTRILPRMRPA